MRKTNLLYSLLALPALILGMTGCTKTNTINNGQVIETPYSLYFTDTAGTLYSSNDGKTSKVIFSSDGSAVRCLFSMNSNLLMAKQSLYVTTNNGSSFSYSYPSINLATVPHTNIKGHPLDLNQSMGIFVQSWSHGYVASRDPSGANYLGIAWNATDGVGPWSLEQRYDTLQSPGVHVGGIQAKSFTLLKNGTLVALDPSTKRLLTRSALLAYWHESFSANTSNADSMDMPGTPTFYSLGHLNDRIIAIDNYGTQGVIYTDDMGATWNQFSGIPANTPVISIASPFEQVCLVGTDSAGLFMLNPNTNSFQQVLNGLTADMVVRSITFKENIFKNGTRQQYVYLATNKGLYQSSDLGANWTRTIVGNFVGIY